MSFGLCLAVVYYMNRRSLPHLFLSFCSLVLWFTVATSCAKHGNTYWLWYDQTLCSDKWGTYKNNEDLKRVMLEYFDSKSIKVYDIEIFSNGTVDGCLSCSCKTGKRIKLKVKKRDLKAIKEEGFYQ